MLKIYAAPPFEPVSADYMATADGQNLLVSPVRVSAMPVNQIFRGVQRSYDETELAAYITFEGNKSVDMDVTVVFDVFRAAVAPASASVAVAVDGRRVSFRLPGPGNYVLEINGVHKPLHIFYNAPETNVPDPGDDNVIFFGEGLHNAGRIEVKSGQILYVAPGARVRGYVVVEDARDVRICGRGMIDVSNIPRMAMQYAIYVSHSENVRIEDLILHDAPCFSVTVANSDHVLIDGVKVIGQWRYNSDGIDLYNSRNVTVKRCFVRTFDDSIVLKGGHDVRGINMMQASMYNILVEDCVVWNDWGRALEIGAETVAEEMKNIVFRRCEILHFLFIACDVQACGDAHVHDILFEDINVGEPLDPQCEPRLTEIFIRPMCWLTVEKLGRVSNVTFRNINYTGRTCAPNRFIGFDADSGIDNIALEQISINGESLTENGLPMSKLIYNSFAKNIKIDGKPINPYNAVFEDEAATCSKFLIGNGAFIKL